MSLEDKQLYVAIMKKVLLILVLSMCIVGILTRDMMAVLSVALGGALSIGGFMMIIYGVNTMSFSGNVKRKVVSAYLFRYLIYFGCMFVAAKSGFDIVCMLIGFLCVNLGIKVNTLLERKEEN